MDKYRKLYNENLLGTSDVSILKFYYASFKIQQNKGKVSNVGSFLDECIEIAADTGKYFKVLGYLPFINSKYGTEQERISKFIKLRRKDIETLFLKDEITDKEIEELLYGISQPSNGEPKANDYYLEKTKEKILKCYSVKGKKQLGDRIFGYLLKSELLQAHTPEERLNTWHQFTGKEIVPSDTKLHANPRLNRSNMDSLTLIEHLESILDFYKEIGLEKAVDFIRKDIDKLSAKN
ncbi:hypothetical protein EZS27_012975 [termite gut metagenome]|uniref:Uncharacterized protein n=1 Tax=termite gut metagenome TaxID=433724 RepID=A0A5J4S1E0_9ZZZZ